MRSYDIDVAEPVGERREWQSSWWADWTDAMILSPATDSLPVFVN